jgi:enterochelin esterase-like enzyme
MHRWTKFLGTTAAVGATVLGGAAGAAVAKAACAPAHAGTAHAQPVRARGRRIDARHRRVTRRVTASTSPIVRFTGRPPTGYTVTFRYDDPSATSVQIKGEWYFSNAAGTTENSSLGLLPSKWRPGDFPIDYPNSPAPNWPVIAMSPDPATGVWSFTTPLPSGVFTYGFYVNCASPTQSGCTEISDPGNPPWNQHGSISTGSTESTSQVYVPSDPVYHSVNYSWQAPTYPKGSLADVTYPSPLSQQPVGQNDLAVYTPPGYDPNRATPYPTLYLSHGGGGNEVDWTTQGDAANILDNLIDSGQIQPMVVVMPNFNGFGGGCGSSSWESDYDQNLTGAIMPYVQSHFDVSSAASQNAFAGLSCGGDLAGTLLVNDTSSFSSFGLFSAAPNTLPALSPAQAAAIGNVGVFTGGGWQDPIHSFVLSDVNALRQAGDVQFPDFINGGHEWYVWRILLRDFLTRVAFQPVLGAQLGSS